MVNRCVIPCCRAKKTDKSVFKVPKDSVLRQRWITSIQRFYPSLTLPKFFCVCEKHFKQSDILTQRVIKDSTGKVIFQRVFQQKRLKPGTVPYTKTAKAIEPTLNLFEGDSNTRSMPAENTNDHVKKPDQPEKPEYSGCEGQQQVFQRIFENKAIIQLPDITWGIHRISDDRPQLLFSQVKKSRISGAVFVKKVIIDASLQYRIFFLDDEMNVVNEHHELKSIDDVQFLIQHAHSITLCEGGPLFDSCKDFHATYAFKDATNKWRHKKCPLQTNGENTCKFCLSLYKTLPLNVDHNRHSHYEKESG